MPKKKDAGASAWTDPDDAPELTDEFFERADIYKGQNLVRRGRPPTGNTKAAVSLRLDADILEKFRNTGPGWQSRINDILKKASSRL